MRLLEGRIDGFLGAQATRDGVWEARNVKST